MLFFPNIFMCFTVYFEPSLTAVGVVLTLSVDVRGLVAVGESVVLKLQVLFVCIRKASLNSKRVRRLYPDWIGNDMISLEEKSNCGTLIGCYRNVPTLQA